MAAATAGETRPGNLDVATRRAAVTVAGPNHRRTVCGDEAVAVSRRRVVVSRVLRAAGRVTTVEPAVGTPVATRVGRVVAERRVVSRVGDRRRTTADLDPLVSAGIATVQATTAPCQ